MKIGYFIPLLLIIGSGLCSRTCRTSLLRSLGYRSRMAPNRYNPLCPNIAHNCCTNLDIMKIHKMWLNGGRRSIQGRHETAIKEFAVMPKLINKVMTIPFEKIMEKFISVVNPPSTFKIHLKNVVDTIIKNQPVFIKAHETILNNKSLEKLYNSVGKWRQGVLCSMCNWNNNKFYDLDGKTLVVKTSFCMKAIESNIDFFELKYNQLFKFYTLVDEFSYLTMAKRLMRRDSSKMILRFGNLSKECALDYKNLEKCSEICKEFNFNRYSEMWDGEPEIMTNTTVAFEKFTERLSAVSEEELPKLFEFRRQEWENENIDYYIKTESSTSKEIPPQVGKIQIKPYLDFKMTGSTPKKFLDLRLPPNPIQVDMLDDSLNNISLYRINDRPVDITRLVISFDNVKGLDLEKDSRDMDFNLTVDQLLAKINQGGGDVKAMNEIIEDSVKQMIGKVEIADIFEFSTDAKMFFKKFLSAKKDPLKGNKTPRKLTSAMRLFIGYLAATFLLIMI